MQAFPVNKAQWKVQKPPFHFAKKHRGHNLTQKTAHFFLQPVQNRLLFLNFYSLKQSSNTDNTGFMDLQSCVSFKGKSLAHRVENKGDTGNCKAHCCFFNRA